MVFKKYPVKEDTKGKKKKVCVSFYKLHCKELFRKTKHDSFQ